MIVRAGKCQYCGTRIVVMTTTTGSLLPVEGQEGVDVQPPYIFDHKIHKSHLPNCEKQRLAWEFKKHRIMKGYRSAMSSLLAEPECKPEF